MNFLAATHSKDLEYCFLFSFLIETFLLQPFCPLCESVHTTEAYRIFLITLALEQGKEICVGILNIYNNLICSGRLLLTNASYVENSGDSAQHSLFCYFSLLNRFDAVSAYMRKMDHYGLSVFLKISHIR